MKTTLTCLLTASTVLTAGIAHAAEAEPAVATNLSLTTNYKYRGQDQSDNKPALQGGFDYALGGFYIGNWNSSIGFTNTGLEMDFYGGYKGQLTADLGYDVGVLQYYYPQRNTAVNPNTTELYGAMSFGPLTGKVSYTASSKYFGIQDGRGTLYLDLSANHELTPGLTLNAHVGATRFPSDPRNAGVAENYVDYKLGATYDLGSGFSLAGAVVGATKKDFYGDINKTRLIVTLTKAL